jgi:hypothetical protein
MSSESAIVYVHQEPFGRETRDWVVKWLQRHFHVQRVTDAQGFERRLQEPFRVVVVLAEALPTRMLQRLSIMDRSARPVLLVSSAARNEAIRAGLPPEAVEWVQPREVRRRLPRAISVALIHHVLSHCRSAIERFPELFGGEEAHRAILMGLALSPAPPMKTVKRMTRSSRVRRAVERRWATLQQESNGRLPPLSQLVRGIHFLRALTLWLSGLPIDLCASRMSVCVRTLEGGFTRFLGVESSKLSLDELPTKLLRLEAELFGWLLERERLRRGIV